MGVVNPADDVSRVFSGTLLRLRFLREGNLFLPCFAISKSVMRASLGVGKFAAVMVEAAFGFDSFRDRLVSLLLSVILETGMLGSEETLGTWLLGT